MPLRHSGGYNDETTFEVPYSHQFNIVGSCNGIICVYEYCGLFGLWNPSIRRGIILPHVPFCYGNYGHKIADGFGFDSLNDDYKIVWISYSEYRLPPERAYIYTLKTNDWREIPLPTTPFHILASHACFVNGTLNWLVDFSLDGSDLLDNHYILTFDFRTDNFAMIELPEPNWQDHRLTVIKGSLAVTSRGNDFTRFWVRKEDNNTAIWSEVYKLDLLLDGTDKIFEMTTKGNLLFHTYYSRQAVYNLETGVLSNLLLVNDESPKVDMEKYIETLELLGKGKTYEVKQPSFLRKETKKKKRKTYTIPWDEL
ncbi:F-box/kelch-repeat protein-like protein [Tanacetum coccineum]